MAASYDIVDTRMKIKLSEPLASNGGEIKIGIDFSFTSLIMAQIEWAFWKLKMAAFLTWLNGIQECAYMTIFWAGTPYPISGW